MFRKFLIVLLCANVLSCAHQPPFNHCYQSLIGTWVGSYQDEDSDYSWRHTYYADGILHGFIFYGDDEQEEQIGRWQCIADDIYQTDIMVKGSDTHHSWRYKVLNAGELERTYQHIGDNGELGRSFTATREP